MKGVMVVRTRVMTLQTEVGLRDFYKEILRGHSDTLDRSEKKLVDESDKS